MLLDYEVDEETIILIIVLVLLGVEILVSIGQIVINEVRVRKTRHAEECLRDRYQRADDTPSATSTTVTSSAAEETPL